VILRPPVFVTMTESQRKQATSILAALLKPVFDRRAGETQKAA
jgi:hypothetical protein